MVACAQCRQRKVLTLNSKEKGRLTATSRCAVTVAQIHVMHVRDWGFNAPCLHLRHLHLKWLALRLLFGNEVHVHVMVVVLRRLAALDTHHPVFAVSS